MWRGRAILAAAAVLTLVSGCDLAAADDEDPPKEALAEAAARLKDTTFEFAYHDRGVITIDGSYDPTRRQGEYTSTQTWIEQGMNKQNQFTTVSRLVAGNRYETGWFTVRFGKKRAEPATPAPWCRTTLPADGNPYLAESFDPAEIPQTLREATDVRRTDDGATFTGRVDATRVSPPRPFTKPEDRGPLPAKTVPFEAAMDGQGRLIRYSIDLSELLGSLPTAQLEYKYSAFGVRVDVTAPPAAQTKAC
jgi:hypothetical protein